MESVLEGVFRQTHKALLADAGLQQLLTRERKLHPQVLVDSTIGVGLRDVNVAELCRPWVEAAEKRLGAIEAEIERKHGRTNKEDRAELAGAEAGLKVVTHLNGSLTAFLQEHDRQLLFFYSAADHGMCRVRALGDDGLVDHGAGGVFNHGLFAPGQRARGLVELHDRSLVVMSEFDKLQLQSLGARLAELEGLRPEAGYLMVSGVGAGPHGAGAVATHTLRELGRMPLVVQNSDLLGVSNSDLLGVSASVVAQVQQALNLHTVTVPEGRSLDAFIRRHETDMGAREALLSLLPAQVLVTRPFSCVRAEIDSPRESEGLGLMPFQADRYAGWTLLEDVRERARLFFDGRQAYVFRTDTKEVLPVDGDNADMRSLLNRYGAAPRDRFFKHTLHAIGLEAQEHGTQGPVYSLSHYHRASNRLYVFDQQRYVYRISTSRIERVDNGTDDVLFVKNPKWDPFTIGKPKGDAGMVVRALLGSLRLREQMLSRGEQEVLFTSWLWAMFFPELFPTRPLLAVIGEKGSGKTSVLRRIGQLLFGPKFQVMGMSSEPKDFDAAVTGDAFVAVDNADANVPWLDDKLAIVATGGTLKRRLLYTTNQLVEFPVTAFVGITSRTPHFRREDVADRLLLLQVERLTVFGAEGDLRHNLSTQRDALMTELLGQLQVVLRALDATKTKTYHTNFRIADFGQFVLRVADAEGRLGEMETTLNRLGEEQLAFTTQDDPIIELLEDWVKDKEGQEVSTNVLYSELKELAANSYPPRAFDFRTAIGFGQYLQGHKATMAALFGATERTVGGRKRLWTFHPPEGDVGVVDGVKSEDQPVIPTVFLLQTGGKNSPPNN